jgi:hypothetical protein
VDDDDSDKTLLKRLIDMMGHGDYSLYEPREMMEENKNHFRKVFTNFIAHHPFNPILFSSAPVPASEFETTAKTARILNA